MIVFSFILVSDNNDPRRFYIETTSMKNPRLRFSALKSLYKKYLKGETKYKPIFEYFALDYSYYVLDKKEFETYEDAMEYTEQLVQERSDKLKDCIPHPKNCVISFH